MLPAYTLDGYLPCTAITEGWFNGEELYDWIANQLLPHCNAFPAHRSVIIMNNASIHVNSRIYFTFSVLKVSVFTFELDGLIY